MPVSEPEISTADLVAAITLAAGRRRGVDAACRIVAGEIIERAPVIVIPPQHVPVLAETDLAPYLEPWPPEDGAAALPLGFAAMYHDAAEPNLRVVRRPDESLVEIVAAVDIEQGRDMTVPRRWRLGGAPQETGSRAANANGGHDD